MRIGKISDKIVYYNKQKSERSFLKILEGIKEKMRLINALKKANNKIYNEKIFASDSNITIDR